MIYNKIEPKDNMKVNKVDAEVVQERVPKEAITKSVKPKKGLIGRLTTGMLGPGGVRKIRDNLVNEIVKPTMKRLLYEAITSTAGLLLYQDAAPPRGASKVGEFVRGVVTPTDYKGISSGKAAGTMRTIRTNNYAAEYAIPDRYLAAEVLDSLKADAREFGSVSVADYYDKVNAPSAFTDHNYGWSFDTICRSTIRPVREGYIIEFPPLELLR